MAYKNSYKNGNGNGNVSWRRRAQIKQLAWPMAEWQIGHRKSSLVLSARFPVVKWRSRSVAKSTYFKADVSTDADSGSGSELESVILSFHFLLFSSNQDMKQTDKTQHQWTSTPTPAHTPFPHHPKNANLVLWRWVRGGVGTQFPQNRIHPGFSPTRPYGPSERDETTLAELIHPYFACEISSLLDVLSFHVHSRRLKIIESLLAGEVF